MLLSLKKQKNKPNKRKNQNQTSKTKPNKKYQKPTNNKKPPNQTKKLRKAKSLLELKNRGKQFLLKQDRQSPKCRIFP